MFLVEPDAGWLTRRSFSPPVLTAEEAALQRKCRQHLQSFQGALQLSVTGQTPPSQTEEGKPDC